MKERETKAGARIGPIGSMLLLTAALLAACSPGSETLSFVGPQVEGVRDIHRVDVTSGERTRLLDQIGGLGTTLLWLPGGERAVVYREQDRNYYVAEIESGSLERCLTCSTDGLTTPALSPDGAQIAWSGPDGIYLQDLQDYQLTELAGIQRPGWLSWAPGGRQLAFAARRGTLQVYVVEVDSGELRQLTESTDMESFAPAWSPRRDRIAFHSLDGDGLHLRTVQADGSDLQTLADWTSPGEIYDPGLQPPPEWSPDGASLLFAAAGSSGDLDIFVVEVDGGGARNLTGALGDDRDPAWSPDGKWIAFVSNRDGDQEIYLMNADGSAPRNLSQLPTTPEMNPAWLP